MADPDYATWLPKQQAADAIGVSTKTLESMAKAGQLQQAFWRRPTGGPALAVYHPGDVARLAKARHPAPAPFVLPADQTPAGRNGHGEHALVSIDTAGGITAAQPDDDPIRLLFAAALRAVTSENSQKSAPPPGNLDAPWLTEAQALWLSGLAVRQLHRQRRSGAVSSIGRGATRRYWRAHVVAP